MYILFEMQTTNNTTAVVTPKTYTNINDAESAAHTALAAAAISQVDCHTVILVDETGNTLRREYYCHNTNNPVE